MVQSWKGEKIIMTALITFLIGYIVGALTVVVVSLAVASKEDDK